VVRSPSTDSISPTEARRIALVAQGFGRARPGRTPGPVPLRAAVGRLGVVQIDSVNAVVRSHYLPLFSRLGPYERAHLDRAAYERRELFEYWGHEASFLPVDLQPLLRWRMQRYRDAADVTKTAAPVDWRAASLARERPEYVQGILDEVTSRGGLTAGELAEPGRGRGPWWGWADGKVALEYLFTSGQLAIASRRNFARVYDLPERVLPTEILEAPTPDPLDAQRELIRRGAAALGIGTVRDLADYYRIHVPTARLRVRELVEDGALVEVTVEGWTEPAYLEPGVGPPRKVEARALLSPFDSLVWERARTERLWGFRYRLEIYTPAPKRVYGYYVLPFLLGEHLVARVDVRADRAARVLRVPGAYAEATPPPGPALTRGRGPTPTDLLAVASALATELRSLAAWLGLERVEVGERGDLAGPVARAID
jgi:uncharacterized protein